MISKEQATNKKYKNFEFLIINVQCRKKNVHLFYLVFDERGICVEFNFSGLSKLLR